MALPFFYSAEISTTDQEFVLNEETSRHVAQVLRMQNGEQLQLTDGKGNLFTAEIIQHDKKKSRVQIVSSIAQPAPVKHTTIAISLVKNAHRFEWFLEKATEIGVQQIVPLLCARTEKQHFRMDRMKSILVSAMLQSQQAWLPLLQEPVKFSHFLNHHPQEPGLGKFIAHCSETTERVQLHSTSSSLNSIILVGPEGDFTTDEIELALEHAYVPVMLGDTRLRTETAGVVAATLLSLR